MQYHDLIETFTQQDVDLVRVFNDVALFNAAVTGAAHMENMATLACRSALAKRSGAIWIVARRQWLALPILQRIDLAPQMAESRAIQPATS